MVAVGPAAWIEISKKREAEMVINQRAVELTRDALLTYVPGYDQSKFPVGFPTLKFCRDHIGNRKLTNPDVILFRRSMTALATITGMKIPENLVLTDEMAHTMAQLLTREAQQMREDETRVTMSAESKIVSAEVRAKFEETFKDLDKQDIVEAVMSGNTTYDKDEEFMKSGMVYAPEEVEMTSVKEFEEATGQKVPTEA